MKDLWEARITFPGAVFLISLAACLYQDAQLRHSVEIHKEIISSLLSVVGVAIIIITTGQVISALTNLLARFLLLCLSKIRCHVDYLETPRVSNSDLAQNPALLRFSMTNDADARLGIIFIDQDYFGEKNKGLRDWIARRWNATMGMFAASLAPPIAVGLAECVLNEMPPPPILIILSATSIIAFTNAVLLRRDMLRMMRLAIGLPGSRPLSTPHDCHHH